MGNEMNLTDEQIAADLALSEKATPGPVRLSWSGYSIKTDASCGDTPNGPPLNQIIATVQCGKDATLATVQRFQDDGEYIVAAYNGYPAAMRELQEMRKPVVLQATRDDIRATCPCGAETEGPSYCGGCGHPIEWKEIS